MQDPTEAVHADEDNAFYLRKVSGPAGNLSTIVLQNENGPCALVAIANTLVLYDSALVAFIDAAHANGKVDEEALKTRLGEIATSRTEDPVLLSALAEFLPKLTCGLDVNPKFDGSFEDSPELRVFDAFGIPIVHGWVLGEIEREELGITDESVSSLSYEAFCALQFSDTPNELLGQFAQRYQSQLTTSGFIRLSSSVADGQLAVLFWNNHFSTVLNRGGQLLVLATDLGYQNRPEIVWEVLEPSGAGQFLNGEFMPSDQQVSRDAEFAQRLEHEEKSRARGRSSSRTADKRKSAERKSAEKSKPAAPPKSNEDVRPKHVNSSKSAGPAKKKQEDRCSLII